MYVDGKGHTQLLVYTFHLVSDRVAYCFYTGQSTLPANLQGFSGFHHPSCLRGAGFIDMRYGTQIYKDSGTSQLQGKHFIHSANSPVPNLAIY